MSRPKKDGRYLNLFKIKNKFICNNRTKFKETDLIVFGSPGRGMKYSLVLPEDVYSEFENKEKIQEI